MTNSENPYIVRKDNPAHKRLLKRKAKEVRFQSYGIISIAIASLFLLTLLTTIVTEGTGAFFKTEIKLSILFDEEIIAPNGDTSIEALAKINYVKIVRNSLKELFPDVKKRKELRRLYGLMSNASELKVRAMVEADPSIIGTRSEIWLPASSDIDMLMKGNISRDIEEKLRRVKDNQIAWVDKIALEGNLRCKFNTEFFTNGDSREPEQAGILGAMIGSFFVILVCIGVAMPLGVGTAIYLQEFAPKNKFTDIIEVNINNLAAVPSIVYGLLGLAVFLNFFGMPRSSAMVGGFALSLLVLPTIVITTRNALAAVPPSIRDAAIGLGASPMQTVMHHVVPLAMPGIMTGVILSIARAIGETAPLLMIGMVAFVADVPSSISDPSTALPVQIYLWFDSPEIGFKEKTSAAIMVLLAFLIVANAVAVYLRNKFERKW